MTGALDIKMRQKALTIIAKFGKTVTWLVNTSTYDPATRKSTNTSATYTVAISPPSPVSKRLVDGLSVIATDLGLVIAASGLAFVPKISDRIVLDGETYQVSGVFPVYSGELLAMWEITCRK